MGLALLVKTMRAYAVLQCGPGLAKALSDITTLSKDLGWLRASRLELGEDEEQSCRGRPSCVLWNDEVEVTEAGVHCTLLGTEQRTA
jgi:hypothetical protein